MKHYPVIGIIPMMFFLPDSKEAKPIKKLIEQHGGVVIEYYEVFTHQIKPSDGVSNFNQFYKGMIYSDVWLTDCIHAGKVLSRDNYEQSLNTSRDALKLPIGKKKRYSIAEGVQMYLTMGAHAVQLQRSDFWPNVEGSRVLPERSADSMRHFYKKYKDTALEGFIIKCLHDRVEFCLSLKKIPSPDFERRFREQYSTEFAQLEAEDDGEQHNYLGGYQPDRSGSGTSESFPLSHQGSVLSNGSIP